MKYYQFLKYSRYTRYGVFFGTLFLMIFSIKIYLNNFSIENNISRIKSDTQLQYEGMYFKENFYKGYLESAYGKFFIQHENNIILPGELILKLSQQDMIKSKTTSTGSVLANEVQKESIINISDPKEAWSYFLNDKFNKLKSNF